LKHRSRHLSDAFGSLAFKDGLNPLFILFMRKEISVKRFGLGVCEVKELLDMPR
jgi:hypothetical protein